MRFFDITIRWLVLSIFVTTLLLKFWISPNDIAGLSLIGSGVLIYVGVLSHSANKVLQAMYTRFENEEGGTLVFFINRPVGNESTKVGMLVRRSSLRLPNTKSKLEKLSKLMLADIMILESSMRAAYPHLPVERAERQDILIVNTGGLETSVPQ